jgi:hypothetical protein
MVRDVKKLTHEPLKPWLWFFVPFLGLPQCWALPTFNRILGRYETRMGIKSWQSSFASWTVFTIIVTFAYAVIGRQDAEIWLVFAAMTLHIFCMLGWVFRVHRAKTADARLLKARELTKSHWWEWVFVLILTPAWAVLLLLIAYDYLNTDIINEYELGTVFVDESLGMEFPMNHVPWERIIYDENSEALHTFQAASGVLTAYVYHYDDRTLNDLSKNRYFEILGWDEASICREHQEFIEDTLNAKTILTCESPSLWGTNGNFVAIVDTGEALYELFVSVTQAEDDRVLKSALEAVEGFVIR